MEKEYKKLFSFPEKNSSKRLMFKRKKKEKKINIDEDLKKCKPRKIQKEFSRPFVSSFSGHQDCILKVKSHPLHPSLIFSGASDGEIKFWLINEKKCLKSLKAHEKFIRGLDIDHNGNFIISCSDDCFLKLWEISEFGKYPRISFKGRGPIDSLSSHPRDLIFATGGQEMLIWDQIHFKPIQRLIWGVSSISGIKFNPIEHNIIISTGSDRSVVLYDLRLQLPVKKFVMEMRSNDVCWNQLISSEFTLANEDSNLYTFDLRNLSQVKKVHQGHVLPVLSLAQDLKNQDLVSGSLDSTIRTFPKSPAQKSEVFFSQRMYRVLSICFSTDERHILSGSEDGNLRLWKRIVEYPKELNLTKTKKKNEQNNINNKILDFKVNNYNYPYLPRMVKQILKLKEKISKNSNYNNNNIKRHIGPGSFSFRPRLKKAIVEEIF
mmetsp:Transcript_6206/g.14652  ORF Transcript_6206/g.14652 Transcript_6206/m.14652 type:complete len:434 (+) Transcript_6206:46-1347(+)